MWAPELRWRPGMCIALGAVGTAVEGGTHWQFPRAVHPRRWEG